MRRSKSRFGTRTGLGLILLCITACGELLSSDYEEDPSDYDYDPEGVAASMAEAANKNKKDAGPTSTKSLTMGAVGNDETFTWDENTVTDVKEGLTWQRVTPDARFAWQDAQTYCAGLEIDGDGWRLPTKAELLTVFSRDESTYPFAPGSKWYWSATPSANVTKAAWAVGMNSYTNSNAQDARGSLRCVRDTKRH